MRQGWWPKPSLSPTPASSRGLGSESRWNHLLVVDIETVWVTPLIFLHPLVAYFAWKESVFEARFMVATRKHPRAASEARKREL